MAGTYTSLIYHLVFSTKHRAPVITPELRDRLIPYMGGIIRGEGGVLDDGNAVADHVHLMVRWMPDVTVSDLLRTVKSKSSGWVHREYPNVKDFWWQEGYGAFSVSESQTDHVRAYIRNQEAHHQKQDFKTEFLAFLQLHKIDYDPGKIWD